MSLPIIIAAVYLAVGLEVAVAISFNDAAKKRISAVGLLGDLAELHSVALLLFFLFWPLWLAIWLFTHDDTPKT